MTENSTLPQSKKTRAERRRESRLYGKAGAKSQRMRDAVCSQMLVCASLFQRYSQGKTIEDIESGLDGFFAEHISLFMPEIVPVLKERIHALIAKRRDEDTRRTNIATLAQ